LLAPLTPWIAPEQSERLLWRALGEQLVQLLLEMRRPLWDARRYLVDVDQWAAMWSTAAVLKSAYTDGHLNRRQLRDALRSWRATVLHGWDPYTEARPVELWLVGAIVACLLPVLEAGVGTDTAEHGEGSSC
jgi:hypothetical protein